MDGRTDGWTDFIDPQGKIFRNDEMLTLIQFCFIHVALLTVDIDSSWITDVWM